VRSSGGPAPISAGLPAADAVGIFGGFAQHRHRRDRAADGGAYHPVSRDAAGLASRDVDGPSPKHGALTTRMEHSVHRAKLKQLSRPKSFDALGEYLEFGDRVRPTTWGRPTNLGKRTEPENAR
jgi:hypothetical protein